ncbi:MAG: hypothetical protein EOP61_02750 [Sphingomonadales bacterium]|nr:MAG: hypothetical protein EOP61_02750 [Sphingomonadales bacterium]
MAMIDSEEYTPFERRSRASGCEIFYFPGIKPLDMVVLEQIAAIVRAGLPPELALAETWGWHRASYQRAEFGKTHPIHTLL